MNITFKIYWWDKTKSIKYWTVFGWYSFYRLWPNEIRNLPLLNLNSEHNDSWNVTKHLSQYANHSGSSSPSMDWNIRTHLSRTCYGNFFHHIWRNRNAGYQYLCIFHQKINVIWKLKWEVIPWIQIWYNENLTNIYARKSEYQLFFSSECVKRRGIRLVNLYRYTTCKPLGRTFHRPSIRAYLTLVIYRI